MQTQWAQYLNVFTADNLTLRYKPCTDEVCTHRFERRDLSSSARWVQSLPATTVVNSGLAMSTDCCS